MQNDFNTGARRAILQPSGNFAVNLAATPWVSFAQKDDGHSIGFGGGSLFTCGPEEATRIKNGIENFNKAGGDYYWLLPNIAINLEVVTTVTAINGALWVIAPGETWKSETLENAQEVYERYLTGGQRVTPCVSAELQQPAAPLVKGKVLKLPQK